MPITVDDNGTISAVGPESTRRFGLVSLKYRLKLEIKGMSGRGRTAYSQIKDLGFRGSREKVLADFTAYLDSLPPPA